MSDKFNLDRQTNIANNIDPTGKKWEIYKIKGTALYTARPNPFNSQIIIPDEFQGDWTKHTLLQTQIELYLNRAWDKSEQAAKKLDAKNPNKKPAPKKTPQESLDELDPAIKEAIGIE